jgi:hypothetical protein
MEGQNTTPWSWHRDFVDQGTSCQKGSQDWTHTVCESLLLCMNQLIESGSARYFLLWKEEMFTEVPPFYMISKTNKLAKQKVQWT